MAVFAVSLFFCTEVRAAERAYAEAGKLDVKVESLSSTDRLVSPTSGGPYPLIVASHGWSASGDNQVGWAKQFASYGFVVAVPTFPSPYTPDAQVNAGIIVGLANDLRSASSAAAHNVLVSAKVGLEGHSAGGLATTVAAAKLGASVGAVVLFDPVDKDDVGKAASATLCAPMLGVFAAPSSCNSNAGWRAFASTTTAELVGFDVVGSTHCDGENESRGLCGLACGGGADPDRQKVYASYATAFFLAHLMNDAAATALLTTTSIGADTAVASALHTTATPTCGSSIATDGGAPSPPAPASSGSAGTASGSSGSSGASGGSNASPSQGADDASSSPSSGTDAGCGCHVKASASKASIVSIVAMAMLLAMRRLRRSRSAR